MKLATTDINAQCAECNVTRGERSIPDYIAFLQDRYFMAMQYYGGLDAVADFDEEPF